MKGGVVVSRYVNYECLMTFLYMREVCLALLFRDFNSSCMARTQGRHLEVLQQVLIPAASSKVMGCPIEWDVARADVAASQTLVYLDSLS